MKKLLVTILLSVSLAGCNMMGAKNEDKTDDKKSDPASEKKDTTTTAAIAVGDTVVARWSTGSFYEGKVESIDGVKAKIKWNDNSNPSDVDMVDVYAMPKPGSKPDVKAGDMVLAKTSTGSYWNGAEITSIDGDVYVVKTAQGGNSANVPPEKIIKVSAATAADMKKQAGSTDFLKEAQAKNPTIPGGYKPKTGERVVAEWVSKSWYTGRVQSVGGKVTIAWDDNSKPSEVVLEKVIPMPNAANQPKPEANDFLLAKPTSGSRWEYVQVVSVNGNSYEVKNASGQTRSVKAGEYIVLK